MKELVGEETEKEIKDDEGVEACWEMKGIGPGLSGNGQAQITAKEIKRKKNGVVPCTW